MHSWVLWVHRSLSVVLLLVVFVAALCAAGLLPYFLAAWSASIPLLALSATSAFVLVMWGGSWLGAFVWHAGKRTKFANIFSMALAGAFVIALYFLVLRRSPSRLGDTFHFQNSHYWQLPTGSRIAYTEYDPPPPEWL